MGNTIHTDDGATATDGKNDNKNKNKNDKNNKNKNKNEMPVAEMMTEATMQEADTRYARLTRMPRNGTNVRPWPFEHENPLRSHPVNGPPPDFQRAFEEREARRGEERGEDQDEVGRVKAEKERAEKVERERQVEAQMEEQKKKVEQQQQQQQQQQLREHIRMAETGNMPSTPNASTNSGGGGGGGGGGFRSALGRIMSVRRNGRKVGEAKNGGHDE